MQRPDVITDTHTHTRSRDPGGTRDAPGVSLARTFTASASSRRCARSSRKTHARFRVGARCADVYGSRTCGRIRGHDASPRTSGFPADGHLERTIPLRGGKVAAPVLSRDSTLADESFAGERSRIVEGKRAKAIDLERNDRGVRPGASPTPGKSSSRCMLSFYLLPLLISRHVQTLFDLYFTLCLSSPRARTTREKHPLASRGPFSRPSCSPRSSKQF